MGPKRCPITYEECESKYSITGLRKISPKLKSLENLPFSAEQQRKEAIQRACKMSIQGVQAKLSAIINIKDGRFEIVDYGGNFILKPQSDLYEQVAENEDLTMRMASIAGIDVPMHGLIYSADDSLTYFVKRFDRYGKGKKYALEDFAQLAGKSRETKYEFSMEKLVSIIESYCTFPALEKKKLFLRTLFCFLTGNEDMHLKNFSLITRKNKIELSPAYDLLNTTIAMKNVKEELALPLNGKRRNISKKILVNYFGYERLQLNQQVVNGVLKTLEQSLPTWKLLIGKSFLSEDMKIAYLNVINLRKDIIFSVSMIFLFTFEIV